MKAKKLSANNETKAPRKEAAPAGDTGRVVIICLALALITVFVYARTLHYGFVAYDDDQYVYENAMVKAGLSLSGISWAFTTFHYANWHPLTWISYLLDSALFGLDPEPFHVVNVLFHAANAVLLFLALFRLTLRPWRSALIAALFAWHPLHVESVAWISERKDVLSTFWGLIALLLYIRYFQRPSVRRYLPMAASFMFSLMAKPMLVTFPLVLLLLDCWPLQRKRDWRLIVEKLPLLLMSAVTSALTFAAQRDYGAVATVEHIPLLGRIQNAAVAYVTYMAQTIWPAKLGALYPVTPPASGAVVLSLLLLAAVTVVAIVFAVSRPYLITGWLWYLGMLVPVIGIIQVGSQSRADRYTYLPIVGLTIAVVWLLGDWVAPDPARQRGVAVVAGVILICFAAGTWRQTGYWKDSRTLFEHTIAVTKPNAIMRNNLGVIMARDKDTKGAISQYQLSLAINPEYPEAHANLGHEMLRSGQFDAARPHLAAAIRLKPAFAIALADMGLLEAAGGNFPEAIRHLGESLRLEPGDAETHSNLCYALQHAGRLDEAVAQCREALRLKPGHSGAQFNLDNALSRGQGLQRQK